MEHITETQLIDYSSGDISPNKKTEYEKHLTECNVCQRMLTELQEDLRAVTGVFPEDPDQVFWASYSVRVRQRMEDEKRTAGAFFLPEWMTALAGVSFAIAFIFMLITGDVYKEIPLNYETWQAAALYQPTDYADDIETVDYALAEIIEVKDIDFLPLEEETLYETLEAMTDEELEAVFEMMEGYNI